MAAELILHHYDFSCYSEKVRLVLGLKGLTWRSVDIPPVLPKPDYLPLTGGYRRAPALQIGADVFCDSKRIIEELERRFPEPSVYPGPDVAAQHAFLAGLEYWTDSVLTRNAINYISGVHAEAPRFTPEFLADRAALLHKPEPGLAHRRGAAAKNLAQLRPQLGWISELLSDGRPYVWGETMSLADCVIYHPLWVMDQLAGERVALIPERIRQWMDRVAARGHGRSTPMTALEAIAVAAAATPEPPLPSEALEGDPALGETVSITPVDYGRDNPSIGTLVSIDARRMALQHQHERTGLVTVHFPRFGYTVRPVSP
ncbi:MAG: glutathione S-transferase family protein [Thermodesulfobacteriota bacterium]|jgi:glutathione S-transferase